MCQPSSVASLPAPPLAGLAAKLTGGGQVSGQAAVILVAVLAATEQALLVVTVVVDARIGSDRPDVRPSWPRAPRLGVHHLVVLTTTLRIGTATAARLLILKTQIAAAGTS